jgi:hypothetical protein
MGTTENTPDYQRGYLDAKEDMKRDLATVLRIHSVGEGFHDEELLSDSKVREIFAGVFGAVATEEEFGPEPTGRFDLEGLTRPPEEP